MILEKIYSNSVYKYRTITVPLGSLSLLPERLVLIETRRESRIYFCLRHKKYLPSYICLSYLIVSKYPTRQEHYMGILNIG